MIMWTFLSTFVLAAVLPIAALPQNAATSSTATSSNLSSRSSGGVPSGSSGPFTNAHLADYADGLYYVKGCGQKNSDSEFIAALNSEQFGNGEYCNKQITITVNGVSHDATIVGECPECPYPGLILTPTLFNVFGNEAAQVLTGEWSFKD